MGINFPAGTSQNSYAPAEQVSKFQISNSGPGGPFALILERVANVSEAQTDIFDRPCPSGIITGNCDNGHRFAKEVYCGREWCQICNSPGKNDELAPMPGRRVSRWYEKAQQIDSMGYWVFTIPEPLRCKYRRKAALSRLGHQVQELLKSYGYDRGLRRWHYFGDPPRKSTTVQKSGLSTRRGGFECSGDVQCPGAPRWHPHLNCLVDGGAVCRQTLRALRRDYSRLLGVKLAIADYHYLKTPGGKYHALKYVARATFLDWRWDPEMAGEIKGFRNTVSWGRGRWKGAPVWSLADLSSTGSAAGDDNGGEPAAGENDDDLRAVASLERGICPECGQPIHWSGFCPGKYVPELAAQRLDRGYWLLPAVPPPRDHVDIQHLEHVAYWRRQLAEVASENKSSGDAEGTLRQSLSPGFKAGHRRYALARAEKSERGAADQALLAEVDDLISRHSRRETCT